MPWDDSDHRNLAGWSPGFGPSKNEGWAWSSANWEGWRRATRLYNDKCRDYDRLKSRTDGGLSSLRRDKSVAEQRAQTADAERMEAEKRWAELEAKVKVLEDSFKPLDSGRKSLEHRVAELLAEIQTLEQAVSKYESAHEKNEALIKQLEAEREVLLELNKMIEEHNRDLRWDNGVLRYRLKHPEEGPYEVKGTPLAPSSITTARVSGGLIWQEIPCYPSPANHLCWIIDNFKICFPDDGKWIYGQGLSWSRYDSQDGARTSLLFNRQHKRFWDESSEGVETGLRLTREGFMKLWKQKSQKWQDRLARSIGISTRSVEELVRVTRVDETKPHLTPMSEAQPTKEQYLEAARGIDVVDEPGDLELPEEEVPVKEGECYLYDFKPSFRTEFIRPTKPSPTELIGMLTVTNVTRDSLDITREAGLVHCEPGDNYTGYHQIVARLRECEGISEEPCVVGARSNKVEDYVGAAGTFLTNPKWLKNGLRIAGRAFNPRFVLKLILHNNSIPRSVVQADDEYICPFDNVSSLPGRSDQWVSGYEVTRLRHPEEMPKLRKVTNSGIHGLPGDFLQNYPRIPDHDFKRLRDVWYDALGVLMRLEFGPNDSPVLNITANADWERSETTVNFVTVPAGKCVATPRKDGGFNITLPCRGIASRSIRLLPLMVRLPNRFKAVALLNGRKADYDNFGWPVFNPVIPLPQMDSFYVEGVAAGRSMYPPGFLVGRYDTIDFLVHTATVYGAEEAFLLQFTHHVRIYPPPRFGRETAFGSWCRNYKFKSERFWYDADWVLKVHETNHDFDRLIEITKACRRNPPEENLKRKLEQTAGIITDQWRQWVSFAALVSALIPVYFTLLVPYYYQLVLGEDPGDLIFLPPHLWLVWGYFLYGKACEINVSLLFFKLDAGKKELVHSSEEFSKDPANTLLIPTMGTRGDHVPPRFFGNMATLAGVKTHLLKLQTASYADLENLKQGKLHSLLPGYLQNNYSVLRGYKAVLTPHVELDMPNATSYTLAPQRTYINQIRYLTDAHKENAAWYNRWVTWFAEELAESFWPDWQVGCLKGCNLPRSADGVSLLQKRTNLKTGKIGWLHGSADPEVVPRNIRDKYPKVPAGDHNEIFRHFDKIYMPGGAGAVQTAIACGCEVVVTDVNLDRDYHTMPTQKDFHQPSVLPFFAWLWQQGFEVNIPKTLLLVGCAQFHWSIRYKHLSFLADFVIRTGLFWWYGCLNLLPFMAIFLMMPRFVKKYAIGAAWLTKPGMILIRGLWKFPIFMVTPRWMLPFCCTMAMYNWWWPLSQDGLNWASGRYELVFEPVTRGKFTFIYPFGHWCLRDTNSMIVYEGRFVNQDATSVGDLFKLTKSRRPLKAGHTVHLVPFHVQKLLDSMDDKAQPYSASHNCTTVILESIMYRSVIGFLFAYGISWAVYMVLRPPQFAATCYQWAFPERTWDKSKMYQALGFAAGGTIPMEHVDNELEVLTVSPPPEDEISRQPKVNIPPPPNDEEVAMMTPLPAETMEKVFHDASRTPLPGENDDEMLMRASSIHLPKQTEEEVADLLEPEQLATVWRPEPVEVCPEQVGLAPEQRKDEAISEWWMSDDSVKCVENDVLYMLSFLHGTNIPEDIRLELVELVYAQITEDEEHRIPEPPGTKILDMPDWRPGNWAKLIDETHRVLSQFSNYAPRILNEMTTWLRGLANNLYRVCEPILELLLRAMRAAITVSQRAARSVYQCMCHWLDVMYGGSAPKRIKTVWGLTGMIASGMTSQKARLAQTITMMEYRGRGNFLDDYENFVSGIKVPAAGKDGVNTIGGAQRRPIKYSQPVMSHQAAAICGFKEGEYIVDDEYQKRIDEYLAEGIPQAVDGVLFGDKNPDRIARSIDRYENEYPDTPPEDKALVLESADAMCDQWPEVFLNRDIMLPKGVELYVKEKYSAGVPFISSAYKSRQALKKAGVMDVIRQKALDAIKNGVYPTQFYHAFAKSQAVDGTALLPPKLKDLRTVVSQDISSYFVDQIFQIEANKRITWETYGAGSGMPLSQAMARIWDELHDLRLREGGQFIIADAKAYDSKCKPALFLGAGRLVERRFANHPSGKGAHFTKVIQCKYQAMQDAWVMGITEPTYDNLVFHVPDNEARHELQKAYPKHFISFRELLDHNMTSLSTWNSLSGIDRIAYFKRFELPPGKVFLTTNPALRPARSSWQGSFTLEPKKDEYRKYQTYYCSSREAMKEDIKRIVFANRDVLSNIHHKNRGGGTGQSATSWDNTATFKLGVISAWARATGKRPADFFKTNRFYNTSDDTVWWSKDFLTSAEVDRFKQAASDFGIMLEIGTTRKITEVEYLSKVPRQPTKEDSEDYKAWRKGRLENLRKSNKLTAHQIAEIEKETIPRFMMVQNPTAIMLRRTAFRYYQSGKSRFLYTACERGSGHALVTAFQPALYKKFAVEYAADLNRLCKEMGINHNWKLVNQDNRMKLAVIQTNPNWKVNYCSTPRQEAFLKWIKQAKFPSYRQVLDIHLRYKDPDPSAHDKFLAKLDRAWRRPDETLREFTDEIYRMTDMIPDEIKRFMPSVDMLYAENPWHTHNQYVEKFIFLRLLETVSIDELTFAQYDAVCKESAYGICMNTIKFWEDLRDPEYLKDLLSDTQAIDKVRVYQAMAMLISSLYFSMHWVELFIQQIFIIGPLYNLFMWSFWGLSKVYGLANTVYWHSKARSSKEISSIMPRDPYMWSKRFVSTVADFIPLHVGMMLLPMTLINDAVAEVIELVFGRVWRMLSNLKSVGTDFGDSRSGQPPNEPTNPWAPYAYDFARKAIDNGHVTVAAKTASGKSTFFPSAVWAERKNLGIKKIWIVVPRIISGIFGTSPFDVPSQKIRRGVTLNPNADIYVTTYGHFLTRVPGLDLRENIVFFDEFHEMDGFMLQGVEKWKGPTIFMSATPVSLAGMEDIPFLEPSLPKRFPLTVYKVDSDDVLEMWNRARNQFADEPDILARPMVIVPTYKEVKKTIAGLENLDRNLRWQEVSRKNPKVPMTGGMVCTPYVQTGIDIKPAPTILIDSGRDVVIHKGRMVHPHPYTDDKTNEQRINRVGRIMKGVVLQPQLAGTGVRPIKYPSGMFFSSELVAKQYKVAQLTPVENPIHPDMPYLSISYRSPLRDEKAARREEQDVKKSLLFLHLMALAGVQRKDWMLRYNRYFTLKLPFGEEEDHIERLLNGGNLRYAKHIPVDKAMHLLGDGHVTWGIGGVPTITLPRYPCDGMWLEDPTPIADFSYKKILSKRERDEIGLWESQVEELKTKVEGLESQLRSRNTKRERAKGILEKFRPPMMVAK
ncbi:ORFB [Cryphonectria hypovirus 2-NB58]|uniref:Helicase ATP-binding domain-containing protein n=1 Tax=Cryphonectria hypovirus 2-NB58 TaxID=40268 RepID=Q66225_9VIRU|nr:polyprotein [Cryphonectria hypovirus 2]AAA20137.1 ORFB [Cryphonectria hypovirus 2-NB58]